MSLLGLSLQASPEPKAGTIRVTPAGFSASQPQVASSGTKVFVAYGRADRLFLSSSADGGTTFSEPRPLPTEGKLSLGMRRGPRIAVSGTSVVVSAIYGKRGGGQDGELVSWRSEDQGMTWQGPVTISEVPGAAREGLHAMASSAKGRLVSAWLDLRSGGTEIWLSTSEDAGASWSKNVRVYRSSAGTVCECCHPSVAFGAKGEIHVMFRNWLDGARDMYLSTSGDGQAFGEARKIGSGTWKLNACPMDGGALAIDADGTVQTVWRREGKVFACVPGEPEREIGEGSQPWIAPGPSGSHLIWQTRSGSIRASSGGAIEDLSTGRDPVIAPVGRGSLAVWEADSVIWAKPLP